MRTTPSYSPMPIPNSTAACCSLQRASGGKRKNILDDPEPQLRALHHYATVTSDILSRMSAGLTTGSGPDGVDADALIQEFRGLADLLEKAS